MSEQLTLPFGLGEQNTLGLFVTGANGELVDRLSRADVRGAGTAAFHCIWLFGAPGVGKTHLLHGVCHRHPGSGYLPAAGSGPVADTLEAYRRCAVLAVDDLGRWLGTRETEVALLGLYNHLRARDALLVVAADRSPLETDFALADLASRLRAAACYRVAPLDDDGRAELLTRAAGRRGLRLGADVVAFLLSRASRDPRDLVRALDRLDRTSLAEHRLVTIPFVKRVLCL